MNPTTIAIGTDHRGHAMKSKIIEHLRSKGDILVMDMGAHSEDAVDYPDFAHPVADAVESGDAKMGIVICGTGNGVAMAVNKHQNIRCGLCWNNEVAELIRQHNDANIIAIPGSYVDDATAIQMVDTFLSTEFEGGRHARRVDKICVC